MENYLEHHGVKGQKWGIRRYQNEDGSLTEEGRKHRYYINRITRNKKTTDAANEIVRSLSDKERYLLGAEKDRSIDWIGKDTENEQSSNIAKRFIQKYENTPVSMLEIWEDTGEGNTGRTGQIAIATRSGEEYRGKGYANKNVQEAVKWFNSYRNTTVDELMWIAESSNVKSQNLAKKNGFEEYVPEKYADYKDEFKFYKLTRG